MSRGNNKKQQASASTGIARLLANVGKSLEQPDDRERIELYWKVGEVISQRIERDGWGKGTVATLADEIRRSAAERARLLAAKPVAHAAVLRRVPRRA